MKKVFKNLFIYDELYEYNSCIYFTNVTLHKSFPDAEFIIGHEKTFIVLDILDGTVHLLKEKGGGKSKCVMLKDWINGEGLIRTDTFIK